MIAIIGVGCRLPGGIRNLDSFWRFLLAGGDGIGPVPPDRWSEDLFYDADPDVPGRMYTRLAGFLQDDPFAFDPGFFGISPREAATLDPQQRLLLEVAWEALEDAGLDIDALSGSPTGVYVGGFTLDNMLAQFSDLERVASHTAMSATMTLLSNRISYTFDFRGPSLTVDTACSSSLVAVHLAVQGLLRADCSLAVAGGVNVMLLPAEPVVMCKGHFLSHEGRSRAFDAGADGYGRGEGSGLIVLKRLEDARRDGNRIHGIIRATAVNQDGRTDGIAMPSGTAQKALMRAACHDGDIDPHEVAYIEAHGTGTAAGDPTECRALGAVYGRGRRQPVPVASVKANIGHLEAAAGIAGLIKTLLVLKHRTVPPHVGMRTPNPAIPFHDLGLTVPLQAQSLGERAKFAAVNSFGYGGINAHVILQAQPAQPTLPRPLPEEVWLPLSARTKSALPAVAAGLADHLAAVGDAGLADASWTLARCRTHHPVRALLRAASAESAVAQLRAFAAGTPPEGCLTPEEPVRGLVWVFTGMGPQWAGMGQMLYWECETFRRAIEEADAFFRRYDNRSILAEILMPGEVSRMTRNDVAQPANFLLQVGLVALLRERGPAPDAVLGHSVGEAAAAWATGAISLEDAARLVAIRSRLQQRHAGHGSMLAVGRPGEELEALLAELGEQTVCVAAWNAPSTATLAGPTDALERVAAALRARDPNVFCRPVRVEVPYHSPMLEDLHDDFHAALGWLRPTPPSLPLYSTLTGTKAEEATHDAAYWWANTRSPVRLRTTVERLLEDGYRAFLEIGPQPVLAASLRETAEARNLRILTVGTLRRGEPEMATINANLGRLWCAGHALPWAGWLPTGKLVDLPHYPWQRERHWEEPAALRERRCGKPGRSPLLSRKLSGPMPAFETQLAGPRLAFLRDHVVGTGPVVPAAAYVEAMLAAVAETEGADLFPVVLTDVAFLRPLAIGKATRMRIVREAAGWSVYGADGDDSWSLYSSARFEPRARFAAPTNGTPPANGAARAVAVDALYTSLAARGLRYGPGFRGVAALTVSPDAVHADLTLPEVPDGFRLHPTLLDAAFQALIAALPPSNRGMVLPVSIDRLQLLRPPGQRLRMIGHVQPTDQGIRANLMLVNPDGEPAVEVHGLFCRFVAEAAPSGPEAWLHQRRWEAVDAPPAPVGRSWWVAETDPALAGELRTALDAAGAVRVEMPGPGTIAVVPLPVAVDDGLAGTQALLKRMQVLCEPNGPERVVVVGRGAQEPEAPADPRVAASVGLARVALAELPERGWNYVDLDPTGATDPQLLLAALAAGDEEEVALRGGRRLALRHVRAPVAGPEPLPEPLRSGEAAALIALHPGRADGLAWVRSERRPPGPDEVEIEVEAASLNFKDVMKARGLLAEAALERSYLGRDLGMEATGRVVRVGSAVTGLAVGERVVTFCGGALRTHLTASTRFVVRLPSKPDGSPCLDPIAAACAFVFTTAWHALVDVARLRAGERVLVQSAAGGVGLAAVQIARAHGAEVFASAGTEEKRAYLRAIGIAHIFDSRTLDFADAVRAVTGGRGVDVILNSLSGPAIERGLDCLAPGGRFIELGKQDIATDRALGLRPFNRCLTFAAVDLDRMSTEDPNFFAPLARTVLDRFADGTLQPLPTRVFAPAEAAEAFRLFGTGALLGKAALDLRAGVGTVIRPPLSVRPDRRYLVTGGLGGFGLAAARWLAAQGARHLVLASRRGAAFGADAEILAALSADGVVVEPVALDVADAAQVAALFTRLDADGGPPLGGIFHAAAVLEDQPLLQTTAESLARVWLPKATGAWNLHRATAGRPLDFFILCSSIAAQVGNPGQAAYAAANTFLDALAEWRQAHGEPATSVAWGALAEAGMVARDAAVAGHLRGLGLEPMPPAAALGRAWEAVAAGLPRVGVVDIDWRRWVASWPRARWQRLTAVLGSDGAAGGWMGELAALPAEERRAAVLARLAPAAAGVFRIAPERLDPAVSLRNYGLDSLMAVELAVAVREAAEVEVNAMELLAGRSLQALADRVLERVGTRGGDSGAEVEGQRLRWLKRICVQPPYYRLEGVLPRGAGVEAWVETDDEAGGRLSASEAGRHLAILGSCAASLRNPLLGRTYYPVHSASLRLEAPGQAGVGRRLRLVASCTDYNHVAGAATATAEMFAEDGTRLATLTCRYHVIPEEAFQANFAAFARPTASVAAVELETNCFIWSGQTAVFEAVADGACWRCDVTADGVSAATFRLWLRD